MMHLLKFLFATLTAVVCGLALSLSGAFLYLSPNLPSVESLRSIELQIPLRVYSNDEKLIAEFGEMRRSPILFNDIPENFIHALLAAEDDNFANHYGVDPGSLVRAAAQILKTGRIQTGGSTITMQVAKNFFLSSERSFSRKANEILLALQIERELTKDEILELYINKIYLGHRAYGIEAASQVYYGKSIGEVSLAELAMIAGLPKAPSRFNPIVNPERSLERRDWILGRMLRLGRISPEDYQEAIAEPLTARLHVTAPDLVAPYIAEMARAEMVGRFGGQAYTDGYSVTTTVPSDLQMQAHQAILDGLSAYDHRHGYRKPEQTALPQAQWTEVLNKTRTISQFIPAIVSQVHNDSITVMLADGAEEPVAWQTMRWARPFINSRSMGPVPRRPADVVQVGDLIRVQRQADNALSFAQIPKAQAALVSLDASNGAIRALVGGLSFEQSNYNRAIQAKRQPGSSFKPFVYSAALDAGYTAATIVNDAPLEIFEPGMKAVWRPKNDNNTFLGPIRVREGLYRSRNLVSIRILQDIGMQYARDYISKFGFNPNDLPGNLSLALGTATLTPLETAAGWTVFANGGYKVEPYLIERIENRDGQTIFLANPPSIPSEGTAPADSLSPDQLLADSELEPQLMAERVIDERTAYIMTDMLQDVIKRGTGRRALSLNRSDLAGKTGTTNESKDSWFVGYNSDYVTSVWAGFDQPESLGRNEYGGTIALPIWIDYMAYALKDKPMHQMKEPAGMMTLRIDPVSGRIARPGTANAYFEIFKSEDAPPTMDEFENSWEAPSSPYAEPAELAPIDLF
ncbi:penicillin-binding protein 1A [Denitrificimonas caeni]|uniref:Penicillin-binding protein 1A n=1 Tax=Denitrificimonas caeni TaxID=521720 RepID=A0AAE9VQY8_9GAMM|nr:penicillin-binding protein 1A [Denitrificimonas caeni]WBE25892.1 penicillin-binding protein 1A [Denitrificimonas caeni]